MKRCVCGKSNHFPICDGQHSSEGWKCSVRRTLKVQQCIVGGPHYLTLVEKLSHHQQAFAAHSVQQEISCQELVIITDGTDIEYLQQELNRLRYTTLTILAIGVPIAVVSRAFPKTKNMHQIEKELPAMWIDCTNSLQSINSITTKAFSSIFISHSVQDEPTLLPIVKYIRRFFNIEIFMCTDSIYSGTNWYQMITESLQKSQKVVAINSHGFTSSSFCAFEMGMARAFEKEVSIITLDNTSVPAYMQDLQSNYLERYQRNNPWLDRNDALIEVLMMEMVHTE
jgi:hypothetical protein